MKKTILVALVLALLLGERTYAREIGYDKPGLDEKLGGVIPLDLTFTNENDKKVTLKELVDRPTCLVWVYYNCPRICPQMLAGLAKSLGDLRLMPGKDYRVITISFDDSEKPEDARMQKINYIRAINRPFPEDAWRFLTGDRENIRRLAEAVGLRFKKDDHGFVHPEVLIFLSPQGRITRYMQVPKYHYGLAYPLAFSAIDLETAFTDASAGKVSVSAAGVAPLFCFMHEPANQKKFFTILKVCGSLTILASLFLFVYLRGQGKSAQRGGG